MSGYRDLEVWQRGRALVAEVYLLSAKFPNSEQFGLTSQLRRSAVSIPTNIAEGYGRRTPAAYCQFLRIAKGSANELETLVILSGDLGFIASTEPILAEVSKIGSMLTNLIAKVESSSVREEVAPYLTAQED